MSNDNYQNHHYFQDGGDTEPNAETAALAFADDDDDDNDGSRRQLLYHPQQQEQPELNGFITNLNHNVIMTLNHEEDGDIEIDNHESFHHGCMIDMEDNDHVNHILGCHVSNSNSDNTHNNESESNTTLASIPTNGYDHAEISNNNDATNNNITPNEFNGEQHDDGENCWQVVPDSLDHLSRDELCRIIYRLDYERNALLLLREQQQQQQQQQLEQPLEFMPASTSTHPKNDHRQNQELSNNNYHPGHGSENSNGTTGNKRKKKRRKTKRATCGDNGDENNIFSSHDTNQLPLVDLHLQNPTMSVEDESTILDVMIRRSNVDENQQQQRVFWNNEFETNNDVNKVIFTTAVEDLRSRLRHNLIDTILSSAIHGGRRVPKSTVAMEGVSYEIARAIVMPRVEESVSSDDTTNVNHIIYHNITTENSNNNNTDEGGNNIQNHRTNNDDSYELIVVAETKRMIKWRIIDDNYIAKVLGRKEERLIHPVRHDGTGIYVVSSSSSASSSSLSSTSTPNLMNDGGIDSRGSNQRAKNIMYHYARFQSLDVKYDKWEQILTIIAKTVAVDEGHGKESASFSSA